MRKVSKKTVTAQIEQVTAHKTEIIKYKFNHFKK